MTLIASSKRNSPLRAPQVVPDCIFHQPSRFRLPSTSHLPTKTKSFTTSFPNLPLLATFGNRPYYCVDISCTHTIGVGVPSSRGQSWKKPQSAGGAEGNPHAQPNVTRLPAAQRGYAPLTATYQADIRPQHEALGLTSGRYPVDPLQWGR